jgi:hypothetical protein
MGKLLPHGQPDVGGVGMAAIIRHFRGTGEWRDYLKLLRRMQFEGKCRIFGDLLPNIN